MSVILVMNIDIELHHSKELTVQSAQTAERNVWVKECWLAGQCGRNLASKTNHSDEKSVLPAFFNLSHL